jgi:hypothetical protein
MIVRTFKPIPVDRVPNPQIVPDRSSNIQSNRTQFQNTEAHPRLKQWAIDRVAKVTSYITIKEPKIQPSLSPNKLDKMTSGSINNHMKIAVTAASFLPLIWPSLS